MTAQKSRPTNGAASTNLAGRPFANSKFTGDVDLLAISEGSENPRAETFLAGWAAGWESRQAEIDRLTWERDLWYFCANNRGKRPSDYYAAATDRLWAEATR